MFKALNQEDINLPQTCVKLFMGLAFRMTLPLVLLSLAGCPQYKPEPDQPAVPKPVPEAQVVTMIS